MLRKYSTYIFYFRWRRSPVSYNPSSNDFKEYTDKLNARNYKAPFKPKCVVFFTRGDSSGIALNRYSFSPSGNYRFITSQFAANKQIEILFRFHSLFTK